MVGPRLGWHHFHKQRGIPRSVDHRQLVGGVLDLPADWRRQRQAQRHVVEIAPSCQPLLCAVAKAHACNHLEVARTPLVVVVALVLGGQLGDGLQTLVVRGVGSKPVPLRWRGAAFGLRQIGGKPLLVLQHGDHVHHVARVIAGTRQVFGPQPIGLQFLVAAIGCNKTSRHRLRHLARQLSGPHYTVGLCHRTQHTGRKHTQPGVLLASGTLRTVARGDVANLMAHHTGQIGLALHVGHDAARHVYIAAGQCEGVDLRAVQHREMPLQLLAVRLRRQPLPQVVHISLHRLVAIGTVLLQHALVRLGTFGHLGGLVHHRAFTLPRDRVDHGGAAGGQKSGCYERNKKRTHIDSSMLSQAVAKIDPLF